MSIFSSACLEGGGDEGGAVARGREGRSYLFPSLEMSSSRSPAHLSRSSVVR